MNKRSFAILVAAVLVMIGVYYMQSDDRPQRQQQMLMPGLSEVLNEIVRVTIIGAGNETVATLERGDGQWTLAERGGYRADIGRIRKNLIALADARIVETKTADPALYPRLGVADLEDPAATGREFIIEAPSETFRLIVGKTGVRGDMAYVRRPDSEQSFLVSADLDPGDDTADWLQLDLLDIEATRVHAVTITHPDGEVLRIEKPSPDAEDFVLVDMPEGRELQYATILNSTAGLLTALTADDIEMDATAAKADTEPVVTRFETFDGLVIEIRLTDTADGKRVRFSALADAELANRFAAPRDDDEEVEDEPSFAAVVEEAERLNAQLDGWTYVLPSFKSDQLARRQDDVLRSPD